MKLPPGIHKAWCLGLCLSLGVQASIVPSVVDLHKHDGRERTRLDSNWKFWRSETIPDNVVYDLRPDTDDESLYVLKPWILPSANDFIDNPDDHHKRPTDEPNIDIPYVYGCFNDSDWETVRVPHDWAIAGPFYDGDDPPISGDMGKLPVQGVGWYRRKLSISSDDLKKTVFLEVDGAMSYPIVWLNGHLVGGWAYGYNSFRLDITPYLKKGKNNQLAIRVENPSGASSRWYPGAGLYRNVWLTKTHSTHVAHYGTHLTMKHVSTKKATVDLTVEVENKGAKSQKVEIATEIFEFDPSTGKIGRKAAKFSPKVVNIATDKKKSVSVSTIITKPKLWGPPPSQSPNLYVAITKLYSGRDLFDTYETQFGIRSVDFDPNNGVSVNGAPLRIQGVNQHHDLGALGAAFNVRAAQRQLELLQEVGVNAIRTAHNPPAPELLELTDRMGFLVLDEIFDAWFKAKATSDFSLIFEDWREPDLRSFLRRDRNHPSVIVWSYGNEVAEQNSPDADAGAIATYLRTIVGDEDPTRPSTQSLNSAAPNSSLAAVADIISLNYQGEGVRYGPAYDHLTGNKKTPQYSAFHEALPDKLIWGSEVAWSLSSRGTFLFPVTNYTSAPAEDGSGGDSEAFEISAYELYSSQAGSSPDRVFSTQDEHPFVAGGFVWAGWDYLGEPYPYDVRSAYSGILDLAGFKKERFYLYQSRWRPDFPSAHIVPHWTWPDREGDVIPVHVFSSGDEAELFINGKSQGKLQKEPLTYRFRWDDSVYEPGELHVVIYKDGKKWATDTVNTAGKASGLRIEADRTKIAADGDDLSFISAEVIDRKGNFVPEADNTLTFSVSGGELVATDNGYQADYTAFPSSERKAFNGRAIGIVRAKPGVAGPITVKIKGDGINGASITVRAK
ncbi:glycoside hydrolase family 2 protein [Trichoderma pleuroticola]